MTGFTIATFDASREVPSIPPGVQVTRLDNGLVIIVREDHNAPVVSAQAWCMAGSIHEGKWLGAGLSHALEHMLFKGTTNRPGSRIDQEVQEAGGYMNAYTSFDRTVYHIDVPNTGARVAVDILCDIMQHASLPPDEIEKEKQVILREMDMNVDDPVRRASRRLFETAYTRSPYRHTVIGYPDIFSEIKSDDILAYYLEKYAPNNIFFVVAGDIQPEAVIGQIREAYSGNKARPLPSLVLPEEPRQTASREIIEEAPVELGYFHIAWHIPELRHADIPALDVLAVVLGNGRSSRLYREVREKQALVHSADAWTYSPGAPGLFGMSATVDADKFPTARDALLAELSKFRTNLVTPEELSKAVKQFLSATLASRKTMQGQAQDLGGSWLAANDLNFSERYLSAVRRVTADDLQRVCKTYLHPEGRTVYALLPTGSVPVPQASESPAPEQAVRKFTLPNGLRLLVKEDHRLPFVEFRTVFRGGVLAEREANSGITQMTGKLLLKGTTSRSAEVIAETSESVGGSIDSYGGNNSFGVNAEVLSPDFAVGLDLVMDVLLNPVFPENAFEREREVQVATLRAQEDQLLQCAVRTMRRNLFGPQGYGLDPLGTEASLAQMKTADLRRFHREFVEPRNCVLAIYGDVQAELVRVAVENAVSQWHPGKAEPAIARQTTPQERCARNVEKKDKKQAVLVIGFPGTSMESPDRFALELLQEACSDLGSRLFLRVREKLGLAYYVGAQNFAGVTPGYFAFYAGTAPEKLDEVETEILREAELLRDEGLTEQELRRTKAKLIGQRKIARQDLGSLAMGQALDELFGFGYDFGDQQDAKLEAVTLEQVKAAAQKYLRHDAGVVSIISPE